MWCNEDCLTPRQSRRELPPSGPGRPAPPWGQLPIMKIALSAAFIVAAGYAAAQTPQQAAPLTQTVTCADLQRDAKAAWWGSLVSMKVDGRPVSLAEFLRSHCLGIAPGPFAARR